MKDLTMTVINGSVLKTKEKADSVENENKRVLSAKLNKKTGLITVKAKKSGSSRVTFNMKDGKTYAVTFTVEKPKAQKMAKKIKISSGSTVTLSIYDLFGTHIDAGVLSAKVKKKRDRAVIKDNKLIITPDAKDSVKVTYKYLNKKYKMTVKIG